MAATYPELFAAATAYSGVPAGCFVSTAGTVDAWNSTCAQGKINATPAYWTNVVKGMYAGYTGARPRFQVYHGSIDATLLPPNYNETVKEWTGVFGYDYTKPATVKANFPLSGYTTDIWGVSAANPLGTVQGVYAINVGHTVPINGDQDMHWFQLGPYATKSAVATTAATSAVTKASSTTTKKSTVVATSKPSTVVAVPTSSVSSSHSTTSVKVVSASTAIPAPVSSSSSSCEVVYVTITPSATTASTTLSSPVSSKKSSTAGGAGFSPPVSASSATTVANAATSSSKAVIASTSTAAATSKAASSSAAAPASSAASSGGALQTGTSTRPSSSSINTAFVAKGKRYFGTAADQGTLGNAQTDAIVKADLYVSFVHEM